MAFPEQNDEDSQEEIHQKNDEDSQEEIHHQSF